MRYRTAFSRIVLSRSLCEAERSSRGLTYTYGISTYSLARITEISVHPIGEDAGATKEKLDRRSTTQCRKSKLQPAEPLIQVVGVSVNPIPSIRVRRSLFHDADGYDSNQIVKRWCIQCAGRTAGNPIAKISRCRSCSITRAGMA